MWKSKKPPVYPDLDLEPFLLEMGWTEVWEHGRCLGILDGFHRLERWVQARPGRQFRVRFISRPPGCLTASLMPVAWIGAEAGELGPQYYAIERGGS